MVKDEGKGKAKTKVHEQDKYRDQEKEKDKEKEKEKEEKEKVKEKGKEKGEGNQTFMTLFLTNLTRLVIFDAFLVRFLGNLAGWAFLTILLMIIY